MRQWFIRVADKRSLKQKFFFLFIVILIGFMTTGIVSLSQANKLMNSLDEMYNTHMKSVIRSEGMMISFKQATAYLERMAESEDLNVAVWHWEDYERYMKQVKDAHSDFMSLQTNLGINETLNQLSSNLLKMEQMANEIHRLAEHKNFTAAQELYEDQGAPLNKLMFDQMKSLEGASLKASEDIYNSNQASAKSEMWKSMIIVIVICAFVAGICILIMRSVNRPVMKLQALMAKAASGDLRVECDELSNNEMGKLSQSFNHMIHSLRDLVFHIKSSSHQLADSASHVADYTERSHENAKQTVSTMGLAAERVNQQQLSTSETSTAMEEMSRGIEDIVNAAGEAMELAIDAGVHSQAGTVQMQQAIDKMKLIRSAVESAAAVVQEMNEYSASIHKVVATVQGISKMTSLLALNASIEAARAGEHGRGFSVVAEEVHKLAAQTSDSLKDIEQVIANLSLGTSHVNEAMEDVQEHVNSGEQTIELAGQCFMEIDLQVQQVSAQMQAVSAATEEMSASSEEIAASTIEVSKLADQSMQDTQHVMNMTKDQLESMSQISSTVEELHKLSDGLESRVNQFELE
ncbi:methyl-accepting chemotaxis protein [Paenibacillus marinisediminis]